MDFFFDLFSLATTELDSEIEQVPVDFDNIGSNLGCVVH